MDKIFCPESIAVIGVSERPDNLAAGIVGNLQRFGYAGPIYAVGRQPGMRDDIPILPSVEALPEAVDLAVILTPAATVPDLMDACGRKGIRRAVIESGGFSEFSEAGRALEKQVRTVARRWGIRFVGPNCISVMNTETGLCLPFTYLDPAALRRGPVSVLAQSGGVSITYALLLSEAGLGVNKVVSMGNKADLDEVDYLTYLLDDPGTEIICLYLESMEAGRRLLELASASPKPVIVQKVNRTSASTQIALSHTAALANDDRIVDAALRQASVARAVSFDDGVRLAQGFTLPPVRGRDLLVISRSGGHAVVAADAADAAGFRLMPIPQDFADHVRQSFRADVIAPTNPLDLGTVFDFTVYAQITEEALHRLDPAALLLIHTYSAGSEGEISRRMARRIGELIQALNKPIALCAFSQQDEIERLKAHTTAPVFTEIEAAVRALAASRERYARSSVLVPLPPPPKERPHEVEGVLKYSGVLTTDLSLGLCAAYGVPTDEWAVVEDMNGAALVAAALGYPVVLKLLAPAVIHKSDLGGVMLNIADRKALQQAFVALTERLALEMQDGYRGVLVQRMFSGGREVILGGKRDPSFGPVVMFGLGGIYVETFDDVAFRLAPLSRAEAEEMIAEVRGSRLLYGIRGQPPADVEALVTALLAVSDLMVACPEVVEVDINPLLVFAEGAVAVDARVVVRQ